MSETLHQTALDDYHIGIYPEAGQTGRYLMVVQCEGETIRISVSHEILKALPRQIENKIKRFNDNVRTWSQDD